jgi:hypothetical protein
MRDLVEAGFTAVGSGGRVKVDDVLRKKSEHAAWRPDGRAGSSVRASRGNKAS